MEALIGALHVQESAISGETAEQEGGNKGVVLPACKKPWNNKKERVSIDDSRTLHCYRRVGDQPQESYRT